MNIGWYRKGPNKMVIKGSCRIVYDTLKGILDSGDAPSISAIAAQSGYHENTVRRALRALDSNGLIRYKYTRPGLRSEYRILQSLE